MKQRLPFLLQARKRSSNSFARRAKLEQAGDGPGRLSGLLADAVDDAIGDGPCSAGNQVRPVGRDAQGHGDTDQQ